MIFAKLFFGNRSDVHDIVQSAKRDASMDAIVNILETMAEFPEASRDFPRPLLLGRTGDHNNSNVVWKVQLRGGDAIHVKLSSRKALLNSDERVVVFVKTREFYAIWRASNYTSPSRFLPPKPSEIPLYLRAKDRNSFRINSSEQPCGIAVVQYHRFSGIDLVEGMFATLWLAWNGAMSFPVVVADETMAKALFRLAGDHAMMPIFASRLFDPSINKDH